MSLGTKQARQPSRRRWTLILHGLGIAFFAGSLLAFAQPPATQYEPYDVVLMLDDGPILARFGIAMNQRPVEDQRAEFLHSLVAELDTNGDGKLTSDEADSSYILRRKISKGTARFIRKRNLTAATTLSSSRITTMFKQVAGQPVVFRQINNAFESDEYIFGLLDEDGSGTIDDREMISVATRLFEYDSDGDDCVGFDELQPPPPPTDPNAFPVALTGQAPDEVLSHTVFSELMRPANDRFLPQRMLRKYDLSGNGKLSPQELKWERKRLAAIDTNGDGELSRSELAQLSTLAKDIDLTVDVAPTDGARPDFNIRSATGQRLARTSRTGIANLLLNHATVTLSYRHINPIPEAIESARIKFNALDGDVNGYLEKEELQGEPLFQRSLFDQMDTDNDGKVFGEELDEYVRERAEVKAMSCQVAIYDTGNGFFQAMDHNNDGRISVRERRSAEVALRSLARDAEPGISREEPTRSYHIEFSRGAYLLFRGGEQISRNSIAFNTQVAVGPPWFSGSDRNNDGDLTWSEFLGHREDFHFLDLDQDGLIDSIEATRAEELRDQN